MGVHVNNRERQSRLCACGCGGAVQNPPGSGRPRKWIQGHRPVRTVKQQPQFSWWYCQCGCGQTIEKPPRGRRKWIPGHRPKKPPQGKTIPCTHVTYPVCGCSPRARVLASSRGMVPKLTAAEKSRIARQRHPERFKQRRKAQRQKLKSDPERYRQYKEREAVRRKLSRPPRIPKIKKVRPKRDPRHRPGVLRRILYETFLRLTSWLVCLGMEYVPPGLSRDAYLIYALVDPCTHLVNYIGMSRTGMTRPREHMAPHRLKKNDRRAVWLRGLSRRHLRPTIVVLDVLTAPDLAQLDELERWWIAYGKASGWPLKNMTDGGIGHLGFVPDKKTRKLITLRNTGRKLSLETRLKISEARKRHEINKLEMGSQNFDHKKLGVV